MDFEKLLQDHGLEAFYISKPENVRYLSGFVDGKDGKVVITRSGTVFITDGRYIVEAEQQRFPHRILLKRSELLQLLGEWFRGRVGIEAEHLSVGALNDLQKAHPQIEFVPTSGVIEGFRKTKQPHEVAAIRKAAALTDAGFAHILSYIKPGVREVDVALELEFFLRKNGAEGLAFGTTVASGERSAMPHGGASQRAIQSGDLVTLDFGCVIEGYCSDMTRTVGVGEVSGRLRELYTAVLEAQLKALEAVGPGQSGKTLDSLARDHLTQHGLAEYFTHSLGHGVGLFIHEGPSLAQTSEDVLGANQIVTVEPGVYIPGVGGCRIEDLVLVTATGYEVLSHSPKEFIQL